MKRVPLNSRTGVVGYALVDDEDYDRISSRSWYRLRGGYAIRGDGVYMAREVMGLEPGDQRAVHHVNEDKIDNRRSNLKVCASRAEANREPHPKRGPRARRLRMLTWDEILRIGRGEAA